MMDIQYDNIYLGDCMQLMRDIPDNSIDCIICDLPYGVLNKRNPEAQWDRTPPLDELFSHYRRITKPESPVILFAQGMFTAQLMMAQPKFWKYNIIWDKVQKTGFLNANRQPLRKHEDILVFYDKMPTYNPQMIKCAPHQRNHHRGKDHDRGITNSCYGKFHNVPVVISDEKFPTSIISITKEHKTGHFFHPTQKPVELLRWLIRTYTNPEDVILDNCMGSGTTCVAAVMEERHFIGMELAEKYFNIAHQRIQKAINDKNNTSSINLFT